MAAYTSSKLVNKFDGFNWLHNGPYKASVVAAHTNLGRTAKRGANRNRSGPVEITEATFFTHTLFGFSYNTFVFF